MGSEEYRSVLDLTPYPRPELLGAEEKEAACDTLLRFLMRERGLIAAFSSAYEKKRYLVRARMNVRPPLPVPGDILALQDALFWTESVERGIVDVDGIPAGKYDVALWEGDITRLNADAIVNAANKSLLGCFLEGHNCIDNVIHSAAGMQLRADCQRIMAVIGHEEAGNARVTRAYNLPSKYVFHTVGPMVGRTVTEEQRADLHSCYVSALDLAEEMGLSSIAFCCISTGVFNFPAEEAAEIAAGAVVKWKLRHPACRMKVIFDTFLPRDTATYRSILSMM